VNILALQYPRAQFVQPHSPFLSCLLGIHDVGCRAPWVCPSVQRRCITWWPCLICSVVMELRCETLEMRGQNHAGVPRFFRWLTERYPLTQQRITDRSSVEIDNLYLDMNGIIHNCTHANEERATGSEQEMIRKCFLYIERLVRIACPRKTLFMAIDGALTTRSHSFQICSFLLTILAKKMSLNPCLQVCECLVAVQTSLHASCQLHLHQLLYIICRCGSTGKDESAAGKALCGSQG
jgi:hypothetical protein